MKKDQTSSTAKESAMLFSSWGSWFYSKMTKVAKDGKVRFDIHTRGSRGSHLFGTNSYDKI